MRVRLHASSKKYADADPSAHPWEWVSVLYPAKLVVRGRQPIPLWLTILIGIVGALVGNYLASAIHLRHTSGIDWIRHILQVGVAAVLIAIVSPFWAGRSNRRVWV